MACALSAGTVDRTSPKIGSGVSLRSLGEVITPTFSLDEPLRQRSAEFHLKSLLNRTLASSYGSLRLHIPIPDAGQMGWVSADPVHSSLRFLSFCRKTPQ